MRASLFFTALALSGPAATAQVTTPQSAEAMTANSYVAAAGASDLYERTSSQLVLRDARRPEVRRFAQMMIADHGKTTSQIKPAAMKSGVRVAPPPRLKAEQQAMIDALRAAPAGQREQLYLTQQVDAHRQALALHKGYASGGDKPALKAVAATAVPIVQNHLREVERLGGSGQ